MADEVLTQRDGAVFTITFNRPDVYNAFNRDLHAALHEALTEAADPAIRCVVVTGAGKGFCAGQDLKEFQSLSGSIGDALEASYHPNVRLVRALEKPVRRRRERRRRRCRPVLRLRLRRARGGGQRLLRARVHRDRPRAGRRRLVVHPPPARIRARVRVDDLEPPPVGAGGARLGPRHRGDPGRRLRRRGCRDRAALGRAAHARRRADEAALRARAHGRSRGAARARGGAAGRGDADGRLRGRSSRPSWRSEPPSFSGS